VGLGHAHAVAERRAPRLKEAGLPLSAFNSSPTRPSSAIHSSLSPWRCAGTGTLSAETMASTVVLVVSIANRVPISGRCASGPGLPPTAALPLSSSTIALAPVTDTMRPKEASAGPAARLPAAARASLVWASITAT
jgi:hypothetical protein